MQPHESHLLFEITGEEQARIDSWFIESVNDYIKPKNQAKTVEEAWALIPSGAIGGNISYHFTRTSLGVIKVVKESVTGQELDLTDYDSW